MKYFFVCLSFFAVLITVSCTNQSAEAKKEVIVVPAAPTKIIVKDPPQKSTTVTVDKNGVKVATKKIDVSVKKQ